MSSSMTSEMHDWIVEVNKELSEMESIPEKVSEYIPHETPRIYRLDNRIRRNFSEFDYTPRIVSFGPHYNGHKSCEPTEREKKNVLLHFLKKSNTKLEGYIEVLEDNVQDLKKKYGALDPKWEQDDAFLRLMVLDGCFLLEVAREVCKSLEADPSRGDYEYDNPVWRIDRLSIIELRARYIHDMLLLENQIPLEVLYKLCGHEINDDWEAIKQVNNYVHGLPSPFPWAPKIVRLGTEHVLGLYHTLLYGGHTRWVRAESIRSYFSSDHFKTASATEFLFSIPSATELKEVGVGFTTSKTTTLMDVSFSRGTLRLPMISVDGATKSIFLNVIAYELFHEDTEKEVTSYIYFMSRLLRDVNDVKLLDSRGIVHSTLSNNEIIEVFDNLTVKDIMRDPDIFLVSHYKSMCTNMRKHYQKMSDEWRRDLWQNYLRSPFAIVSVIAAFFLFSLASVQTVYSVLGYYNPK